MERWQTKKGGYIDKFIIAKINILSDIEELVKEKKLSASDALGVRFVFIYAFSILEYSLEKGGGANGMSIDKQP